MTRSEVIVVNLTQEAQNIALSLDFLVRETETFNALGFSLTRLVGPLGRTGSQAVALLRARQPQLTVSVNDVYGLEESECRGNHCRHHRLVGWSPPNGSCQIADIGVIDTQVEADHPVLRGQPIEQRSFIDNRPPAETDHGTAVVSIIAGRSDSNIPGLAPGAKIYVAGVFHKRGNRKEANAFDIVEAFDWLASENVRTINLSFSGPNNSVLERAVSAVAAQGALMVAAAGNKGPLAGPAYPAAYDQVIAVTAVDTNLRPYRRANRGDYITVAAPGVRVWTAANGDGGTFRQGTSFASPFVTAILASANHDQNWGDIRDSIDWLKSNTRDLGEPGKDRQFGWGLIRANRACIDK